MTRQLVSIHTLPKRLQNGTNKYIEARTQTKSGQSAISKLVSSKTKYSIYVTDKLLVSRTNEEGKYALSGGEADINTSSLVVSTNTTKADAIDGTVKAVTLKDGKLVEVDVNQDNLIKPLDNPDDETAKAYKDSGLEAFENNNPYRTDKERVNGTGAHEETHLTPYGVTGKEYTDEGRAFTAEKKARTEYIKQVYKEDPK